MLRAIGRLFGWLWSGLDALRKVLHLIVLLVLFGMLWGVLSRPIPIVPGNAALVIAPEGPVVEQLEGDPIERTIAEGLRREPSCLSRVARTTSRPSSTSPRIIMCEADIYSKPVHTSSA